MVKTVIVNVNAAMETRSNKYTMYRDMSGSLRNRTYNPFTHTHTHKQSSIHICKNIHTYTHMRTIYTYICTQTNTYAHTAHTVTQ